LHISVATYRIFQKSSQNEKARAWVKEGLELFNVPIEASTSTLDESGWLAQQFLMETDDEEEEEDAEEEGEDPE
tara:strand:+ start:718 stop:939 length:222 start_codon:yes stop_codon:yes gene_type:complete